MELPTIPFQRFGGNGTPAFGVPFSPIDYGISVPRRGQSSVRELSGEECCDLFGVADSVKMNFIPQMLIHLAMVQCEDFIAYCREHRISEFKKHNRVIRLAVKGYNDGMAAHYGSAAYAYQTYCERYLEHVALDRVKMWFSVNALAKKQLAEGKDYDAATHVAIIHNLLDYAEVHDRKIDRILADKLRQPVSRAQNKMLRLITAMCIAFEDDWGFKISGSKFTDLDINMAVLANRASAMADAILDEEANVSKC